MLTVKGSPKINMKELISELEITSKEFIVLKNKAGIEEKKTAFSQDEAVLIRLQKGIEKDAFDKRKIAKVIIEIKNIKNISLLKFEIDFAKNMIAIIGENGSGKSTLLTCLSKLVDRESLKNELQGSDSDFEDSFIQYSFTDIDNNKVDFKWIRKQGWICVLGEASNMPKLDGIFESTIFFGNRFIKPFDKKDKKDIVKIEEETLIPNSNDISKKMGDILYSDENSFKKITEIEKTIMIDEKQKTYKEYFIYKTNSELAISQIDWSSGEYLLFKILEYIIALELKNKKINQAKLIIIDELELSLHPLAQKRIIGYLNKLSQCHNLLIIITTHSPYIIREINQNNIFNMKKNNADSFLEKPPIFIGHLISELTGNEYYDRLLVVEDNIAKLFVHQIILTNLNTYPKYNILPFGGWSNILNMIKINKDTPLFNAEKVLTILDGDVLPSINRKFNELNKKIETLQYTREEIDEKIKSIKEKLEKESDEDLKKELDENVKLLKKMNKEHEQVHELEQYQKTLKTQMDINNNNIIFLPIFTVEKYTKEILLNDENFIKQIERDYSVNFEKKLIEELTVKKSFQKFIKLVQKSDSYFNEKTIIGLIIDNLEKDKDSEYLKFKTTLLDFFKA